MTIPPRLWSPRGLETDTASGYSLQYQQNDNWWRSGEYTTLEEVWVEWERLDAIKKMPRRVVKFSYGLMER